MFLLIPIFSNNVLALNNWWNDLWFYRIPLNISEKIGSERINYVFHKNITVHNISDCYKEIRVTECDIENSSICNNEKEIPIIIKDGDNSTWCDIEFVGNLSSNSWRLFYIYFNNPNATYPNYGNYSKTYFSNSLNTIENYPINNACLGGTVGDIDILNETFSEIVGGCGGQGDAFRIHWNGSSWIYGSIGGRRTVRGVDIYSGEDGNLLIYTLQRWIGSYWVNRVVYTTDFINYYSYEDTVGQVDAGKPIIWNSSLAFVGHKKYHIHRYNYTWNKDGLTQPHNDVCAFVNSSYVFCGSNDAQYFPQINYLSGNFINGSYTSGKYTNTDSGWYDLECYPKYSNSDFCIAVGYKYSTNEGKINIWKKDKSSNWNESITSPAGNHYLDSVSIVNNNSIWITGNGGYIIKGDGDSWYILENISDKINVLDCEIDMLNDDYGWVACDINNSNYTLEIFHRGSIDKILGNEEEKPIEINLLNPQNNNIYKTGYISLSGTTNLESNVTYSFDNGTNQTICNNCTEFNTQVYSPKGQHTICVYAVKYDNSNNNDYICITYNSANTILQEYPIMFAIALILVISVVSLIFRSLYNKPEGFVKFMITIAIIVVLVMFIMQYLNIPLFVV